MPGTPAPSPAPRLRYPLMAGSGLLLLVGMWAGLVRLGWGGPVLNPYLPGAHGAIMVGGVLGTLIGLERAVALRARWAYLAPLLSGLGGAALIGLLGADWPLWTVGPGLLTLGSLALLGVYGAILRRQPALFTWTMAAGAAVWAGGNLLWLAWLPIYQTALWWAGFLVLTIAGERLELTRLLPRVAASRPLFLAALGATLGGLVLAVPWHDLGARLLGAGFAGLALWLIRYDIARRTVRRQGLTRYMALSLLTGYAWLLVTGGLLLGLGGVTAGPYYDAVLHSVFLGFVFAMIFAHAPVILPAVTGLVVPYRPRFYSQLIVLHVSLVLRIGSDLTGWAEGRQYGGLLNALALLLFLSNTAWSVAAQRRQGRDQRAGREYATPPAPQPADPR